MKNYYHILGLSLDSNPDAELISQCHKALIKIFHPDVFKGDKKLGEKKVREINEAYEVLRDKKKRKKYDEDLKNYLNQQNKSSRTTDNSQQNNYKTDKDFNDKGFDNKSSEESKKGNPWAVLGPIIILIFVIVRWLIDNDSQEKVVSSPSSNKVQEYLQSEPVIEKKTVNYNNGVYVGGVLNGKRHGYGVYRFNDGEKYEGNFKNDEKHGYGVYTFNSGNKYKGNWKNGEKHGYGVFKWNSGEKYEGNYLNGNMNGKGTLYFPNGDRYVGDFQNDNKHGQGKYFYNGGTTHEGGWKNGKKNGYGKQYFTNGVYEGNYLNDARTGEGTYRFFDSGQKYIGSFKNGQQHGYGKYIDKYGLVIEEGIYENGKKK